jgi:hypothetical protein
VESLRKCQNEVEVRNILIADSPLFEAFMIRLCSLLCVALLAQNNTPVEVKPLEKSSYFAFVDRDYIFTIEVVKPGIPLLNFVSMSDEESRINAKDIRLALANRKVAAKLLSIETGEFQRPMSVASLTIHPRSSFGVRIDGDFGDARQLYGATIRLGDEDLQLAPLSSFDFEVLVAKVNRLNLGSPDFSEDLRVLKLEPLGSRSATRRRNRYR